MTRTPRDDFWSHLDSHVELEHGSRDAPLEDVRRFDSMDSLVYRVLIDEVLYAFRPAGPGPTQARIAQHTWAAFLLNRALSLQTVPDAAIARLWIHQKGQTHAWTGILSRWLIGKRYNSRSYQHALTRDADPVHLAATQTFEHLINNTDVHHGNFYLDDAGRPVVFDHSLAFGPRGGHAPFFLGSTLPDAIPATLLATLQGLTPERLTDLLEAHLDAPTLDLLIFGREHLLEREAERLALLEATGDDFEQADIERLRDAARSDPEGDAFAQLCQRLRARHPDHARPLELLATLNVHDRPEALSNDAAAIADAHPMPPELLLLIADAAPRPTIATALAQSLALRLLDGDDPDALEALLDDRPTPRGGPVDDTLTAALIHHRVNTLERFDALPDALTRLDAPQDLVIWSAKRLIGLSQPAHAQALLDLIEDLDARDRVEIALIRRYAQLEDRDALYAIAYEGEDAGFSDESIVEANAAIAGLGSAQR